MRVLGSKLVSHACVAAASLDESVSISVYVITCCAADRKLVSEIVKASCV